MPAIVQKSIKFCINFSKSLDLKNPNSIMKYGYTNPDLDPRDELICDIQQAFKEVYAKIEAEELRQA
jgi:hypothetical protein